MLDEDAVPEESEGAAAEEPEDAVLEEYVDWFGFRASATTVILQLFQTRPDKAPRPIASLRMSPEFAKMLAIAFKWQVRGHELEMQADIAMPASYQEQWGIDLNRDWVFPALSDDASV